MTIVEGLPYEARVGFIAFCADRCLKEAHRHPLAKSQLEKAPLLGEGLELLWARAEKGVKPDPNRLNVILSHLSMYETPAPDGENVLYNADISLVQAARVLTKGIKVLQDPEKATPRYVAGALEGPFQSVSQIYEDYRKARTGELKVIDTSLLRLQELGNKPFTRTIFDGVSEWKKGELSKKYAKNQLKGSAEDDNE